MWCCSLLNLNITWLNLSLLFPHPRCPYSLFQYQPMLVIEISTLSLGPTGSCRMTHIGCFFPVHVHSLILLYLLPSFCVVLPYAKKFKSSFVFPLQLYCSAVQSLISVSIINTFTKFCSSFIFWYSILVLNTFHNA